MLRVARPFTSLPLFTVLERLHSNVVNGPETNDGCLNVLTLRWPKHLWPWAEITHTEQGALITDVCTSSA